MEMQELIAVEAHPAVMSVNFDELKDALATELARYDVVVTADTVADAKKLMTQLRAGKKELNDLRKAEVAKASEPIKRFDEQMKELSGMYDDGVEVLKSQVQKFEDETRHLAAGMLKTHREALFKKHKVTEEFQRAEFDDIAQKLSSVTAGGNLSKAAKDELERRVITDQQLQGQTERRLLELENRSHRAELAAPLTRDHVLPFLFADDEVYERELSRILSIEIERQEQAEAKMRRQRNKEQAQAEQRQSPPAQQDGAGRENQEGPAEVPRTLEELEESEPPRDPLPDGRIPHKVTCTFEVNVKAGVTEEAIQGELRRVLEGAGITTLQTITVEALPVKQEPNAA